jgi:glyoxylase-like metal-dependent hydrolase (beta-lactamase superfamily II)
VICTDERQYVPAAGQRWTTQAELRRGHRNAWRVQEAGLFTIHTVPAFAINQRAFLLKTGAGNVLWDCVALLDDATVEIVRALGGIRYVALSHPHYYTTMQDWAREFGAKVFVHEFDRQWVVRQTAEMEYWSGDRRELLPGVTLVRLGGHFPGGTVLHWEEGAESRGVVLPGDIIQITQGAHRVSFLWSYPNMLPLPGKVVRDIAERIGAYRFERMYGAFEGQEMLGGAAEIVRRSADRYVELVEG